MRWLGAGLALGFLAALAPACGSSTPPCSTSTCTTGCCDGAGVCQAGNQPAACGSAGLLCSVCPGGTVCVNGFCSGTGSGGGAGTGGGTATGGGTGTGGGTATGGGTGTGGGTATGGGTGGGTPTGGGTGTGGGAGIDGTPVVTEVQGSGGCVLQLTGPMNCAEIDFGPTGWVEFSWTTNTTFCEGPHQFLIGGHPVDTWTTSNNGLLWSLTSTNGNEYQVGTGLYSTYAMVRNIGGYVHLRREDLLGITTTTGQYHWMVAGFYDISNGGSRSASRTFTIKP